jgi:hypothetical protein
MGDDTSATRSLGKDDALNKQVAHLIHKVRRLGKEADGASAKCQDDHYSSDPQLSHEQTPLPVLADWFAPHYARS